MTPETLLAHYDSGALWPASGAASANGDVPGAYQTALAVRALRQARGEVPRGYKIGFTNRNIWAHYNVFGPIWGTVWSTTLAFCGGDGSVSLDHCAQPRIEPEAVLGLRATPAPDASLDDLFDAIDWVAPGFEIVQSHQPDWKFNAAQTVADSALHARLLVGPQRPVREFASSAAELDQHLAAARVTLLRDGELVEQGKGANVLEGPLSALHYFLKELRACPGAPDLMPGDVVTTGTWTNAWPVQAGQRWSADFDAPLSRLSVTFT
ncbi:hydratase [Acidovorax sp. LjRoot66]|uniref:2-keto-4-pentenoate hydratase n=1 Tax=Acidovorax sp. LjRoot66 TaxID=3342334 RepID=UPI003ED0D6E6